jgi:hypothetical protein
MKEIQNLERKVGERERMRAGRNNKERGRRGIREAR